MKKWENLENQINKKLEKTFSSVGDAVASTTPEKIRSWKKGTIEKISHSKQRLTTAPLQLGQQLQQARVHATQHAIDIKLGLHKNMKEARKGRWQCFGHAAGFIALLEWAILPSYKRIISFLGTFQPATLASGIIIVTVGTIAGIGVYTNSHKIAEEAGLVERVPASIERVSNARPKYYKRNERELLISNVIIPSYNDDRSSIKKLQVDFTIVSSNRYIREFFFENTHLVEDVFNSYIEPMTPGFPLGNEGKLILKEKIKDELNALLKRVKIEGSIDHVYISSILAA